MNNIQEMDWAEDRWHGHTGMDSGTDYCTIDGGQDAPEAPAANAEPAPESNSEKK